MTQIQTPWSRPPGAPPSRLGLYLPFGLLAMGILAWTVGWFWLRAETFRRMDAAARVLGEAGYQIDWSDRKIDGYPFRLDLTVREPRLREAGGWGLSADVLKAEAFTFAPSHWVIVLPEGARMQRRVGGPLTITAKALRASLSDTRAHPPRLSVEGLDLTFSPGPGGAPFPFEAAGELHIHSKSGPQDQGAVYFELDRARPTPGGLAARVLDSGGAVDLIVDGLFSHASAVTGSGAAGALRAWTQAGGGFTPTRLYARSGSLSVEAKGGHLDIDSLGDLRGALTVSLEGGPELLARLGRAGAAPPEAVASAMTVVQAAGGAKAQASLTFQAGRMTLGPVALGPSPRLY